MTENQRPPTLDTGTWDISHLLPGRTDLTWDEIHRTRRQPPPTDTEAPPQPQELSEAALYQLELENRRKAERLRRQAIRDVDQEEATADDHEPGGPLLDLAWLLRQDFGATEFITRPLLQPGGQIALIGDGKVGKSLFALEWACRLANGHSFLGNDPGEPVAVGYIDMENPHPEIQRRLRTLGYDRPELIANLRYASFPNFGPLDTPAGAATLVAWVEQHKPQILYLDTISRMIAGKENDADTWLQLYRLSLAPLKALGVAVVRLDHFGKDRDRGGRGSSAKSQDVDHVWEMTSAPNGLVQLRRAYTRNGIGDGLVMVRRLGRPEEWGTTTHELAQAPSPAEQQQWARLVGLARVLDGSGIDPAKATRRRVEGWLAANGHRLDKSQTGRLIEIWRGRQHDHAPDDEQVQQDPMFDLDPERNR